MLLYSILAMILILSSYSLYSGHRELSDMVLYRSRNRNYRSEHSMLTPFVAASIYYYELREQVKKGTASFGIIHTM
jgi:hypothetical protein